MQQTPSSEAGSRSASQETPRPSWNPKFQYNVHRVSGSWCVALHHGADRHSRATSHGYHVTSVATLKKKLHGLSPRANYTDRATAACRRSDCQLLRIRGDTLSPWRIPTAVLSVFWTGAVTFLSSSSSVVLRGWVDPVPDPLLFFSGSAGNRTRASGSVAKNSDH
jgi:hypothetical protein